MTLRDVLKQARHGRMRQRAYQKILGSTKIWVKKRSKKFGQNRVSNSRDIDDIDKCYQDIFCLGKCHHYEWSFLELTSTTKVV